MIARTWMRLLMIGLSALIAAGCQGDGSAAANVSETAPHPGALAPAFTVSLLDGQDVALADLRGKPLILNFWATWCGPCRREMPRLQAVKQAGQADVAILAVNYGEAEDVVAAYVNENGVTLPVALDPDLALARDYLIYGMPTTFFIDVQGVVQAVHTGELTDEILAPFVARIQNK